ncbi:MAG: hypothetical protein JWN39_4418 [Ilumatobacteraceae bacterium]|nr:hypothetical protein [Ilumatobacteraceae bacterium]
MSWEPGPRPAWVQHAIDGEGGPVYALAAQPLVVDELLAEARVRAGLDDWGDDLEWLEPLQRFVDSVEGEARLHIVGRWRVREVILRSLENRLRIHQAVTLDPGVLEERIVAPVIVTGSPRAGTSVMHELLALLPGTRAPLAWEYWWPAPPPTPNADGETVDDPRIPLADRDVRLSASLNPSFDGMHVQGARVPREDPSAMLMTFRSDVLAAHYPTPSYGAWLATCDMRPAYEYHRLVLQLLQRRHPDRTWVLKAPSHLAHLPLLLDMYPDARVVVCHRDPLAMISSVTSLTATLRWGHAESVDYHALARENMAQFGRNLDAVLAARRSGLLTDGQVVDVRFDEFVRDQAGVVTSIARHFGLDDAGLGERVAHHLDGKPAAKSGSHQHSIDDLGLDIDSERKRFAPYMEHFGIPEEQ